jgi:hypothetical protein
MSRHRAAVVLALLGSLSAQATFVPDAAIRLRVDGLPELFAALPGTHLGRLIADPVAQAALQKGREQYQTMVRRRHALLGPVQPLLAEQGWWLQQAIAEQEAFRLWHETDWQDLRSIELVQLQKPPGDHGSYQPPRNALSFHCTPRAEGRLTARFERIAQELRQNPHWRPADDEKIGGVPGHVLLAPPPADPGAASEPPFPAGLWLLHLPGQFVLGGGPPAAGTLVTAPAPKPAGASATFDVQAMLQNGAGADTPIDPVAAAIGLGEVLRLDWTLRIAGELLLDELAIVSKQPPTGLIGALLTGTAELPAQALPKGALLQLRVATDPARLADFLAAIELGLPPEPLARLLPNLTGGIAFGVATSAAGAIPRLFATLGLRDADDVATILDQLVPAELRGRNVTYAGVRCTTLRIPDAPAGLQPAFAVHDGRLWIAETGRSLRDLLAAQTDGAAAMDVGDAPLPPGDGDPLPTFDLRFDEALIYRTLYDVWLPLYALSVAAMPQMQPLVERADLPTPDDVAAHLGRTRGVLRRRGDHLVVQHLGRLGGPVSCGYAMTWGPMASASIREPALDGALLGAVASGQLAAAWAALSKWRDQHGSFPPDLGALVKAGLLQTEQLLLPGDLDPDVLRLDANRVVKSSYRYFQNPVEVPAAEGSGSMLLIGIEVARSFYCPRPMLADDGTQPQVWGDTANKPIAEFGK